MKLETRILQNLTQQQKLSQRQQQDLKILEMNHADLENWIEEELERNPLLEIEEGYEECVHGTQASFDLLLNYVQQEETLSEVLRKQIATCPHPILEELANFLVDSLDGNGYLSLSDEEIQQLMPAYSLDDIEDTINEIQTFEPAGVCARSLQECLLIQLCFEDIPYSQTAIMIVNYYLPEVSENRLPDIAKALDCSIEEINHALTLIRSLNPKPGAAYAQTAAYVSPDMEIRVEEGDVHIELLHKTYGLRLASLRVEPNDVTTHAYIKKQQKEAQSLLQGIAKRNATIERIMEVIVAIQQDFFLTHAQLKPLTLKDVAKQLELHESTISRAIAGKSILFETQIIPLKFFFPTKLQEGTSVNEVQLKLKEVIQAEDKKKPYSDQKLCDLLQAAGYEVSRRTIAKYRDLLHIPAASKRKQF